jgi:transposase
MRYELTDHEWAAIKPMLPNKPRGVPRANDRRVLQRHLLGLAIWRTVARSAGDLRSLYYLLQPFRSLATGWRLGPDYGCTGWRT